MSTKQKISIADNLWCRMMVFEKAGDTDGGHAHAHSHWTLLAKGRLMVTVDGAEPKVFEAPHFIYTRAKVRHVLCALEAGSVAFCIHALRDGMERDDIIDPDDVPPDVDPFAAGVVKPL